MAITLEDVQEIISSLEAFKASDQFVLRPEQEEAYDTAISELSASITGGKLDTEKLDGWFEHATGVGKTVLFNTISKAIFEGATKKTGSQILIVVPKTDLLEQTVESLATFFPDLFPNNAAGAVKFQDINLKDAKVGLYYGDRKDMDDRPILITTDDMLVEDGKKGSKRYLYPDKFKIVHLDEGHNYLGGEKEDSQIREALAEYKGKAIRIGYSATPEVSGGVNLGHLLGKCWHRIPAPVAYERGLTAPGACYSVNTHMKLDKGSVPLTGSKGSRDFNTALLSKALNTNTRNDKAVKIYMNWKDPETGERIFGQTGIARCQDINHAADVWQAFTPLEPDYDVNLQQEITAGHTKAHAFDELYKPFRDWLRKEAQIRADKAEAAGDHVLAERFRTEGIIVCEKLDYKSDPVKRRQIIADHRAGKILILAGVNIPSEGYDNPRAGVLFELADTLSIRKKQQAVGRVQRLFREDPGKYWRTFEFVDIEDGIDPSRRPMLYAETLDPNFKFRSSAEVRERHPRMPGSEDEFHEPLPAPVLAPSEAGKLAPEDDYDVQDMEETLRFARDRVKKRLTPLPDECKDWLHGKYILGVLGIPATMKNQEYADAALMNLISRFPEEAEGKIGGPYKQGTIESMYIEPALFYKHSREISGYLAAIITESRPGNPLPVSCMEWVSEMKLHEMARDMGLPPLAPGVLSGSIKRMLSTPDEMLRVQGAPDSPVDVRRTKRIIKGPFNNGTVKSYFVHPDAAWTILQNAHNLVQTAAPDETWLTVPELAERLNIRQNDPKFAQLEVVIQELSSRTRGVINLSAGQFGEFPKSTRVVELFDHNRAVKNEFNEVVREAGPLKVRADILTYVANELKIPCPPQGTFVSYDTPREIAESAGIEPDTKTLERLNTMMKGLTENTINYDYTMNYKAAKMTAGPFLEIAPDGLTTGYRANYSCRKELLGGLEEWEKTGVCPTQLVRRHTTRTEKEMEQFYLLTRIDTNALFLNLLKRPPTDAELEKVHSFLEARALEDDKVTKMTVEGRDKFTFPNTHDYYDAILSHCYPDHPKFPAIEKGFHYDSANAVARSMGITNDQLPRFDAMIGDYQKEKPTHVIGPAWRINRTTRFGDNLTYQSGMFVHYAAKPELKKRWGMSLGESDFKGQHIPTSKLLGMIHTKLIKDADIALRTLLCTSVLKDLEGEIEVSDHFVVGKQTPAIMKRPTTVNRMVNIAGLVEDSASGGMTVHPTMLPYMCLALGIQYEGNMALKENIKLFPAQLGETKNWALMGDWKNCPEGLNFKDLDKAKDIIKKWALTGKTFALPDGQQKNIFQMAGLYCTNQQFKKIEMLIDPKLVPFINEELAQGVEPERER